MDHFTYRNDALHAEDVSIGTIAAEVGTPFYCYSEATLVRHAQVFTQALSSLKQTLVCFAVKANSNLAVLKLLGQQGLGADVVSEGELRRALAAGIPANKIVFSGVGKTRSEMEYALSVGIHQFNVESDRELLLLNEVAKEMDMRAPIALRVNPDVDAQTHAKISTGKAENKFGIAIDLAPVMYALAKSLPHIFVQGVSVHIGSQLTSLAPFRAAYARVLTLVTELRAQGIAIRSIDLGGGLGVPYASDNSSIPLPSEYGAMVSDMFAGWDGELIFEPGRLIAANAGILVSKVLYVKRAAHTYVIVDSGMNDLMRPALYDAVHEVVPVTLGAKDASVSVVGPVCESSDVFVRDLTMPLPAEGDLVAMRSAGAYGASMSNTYNSRLLIPEVLVQGDRFAVIRKRPSYTELMEADQFADWQ